jgi:thiosulfate reductase cytochrome b subunit
VATASTLRETPASAPEADGSLIYRHRWATRIWHWVNAVTVIVLLMSGLMIFNAHPRLYWGKYGANPDRAWLQIGSTADSGYLQVGPLQIPTTGVLGWWKDGEGNVRRNAFPGWATIPSTYNLAGARSWHILFAWLLVVPGLAYWLWGFASRHVQRDLAPTREELKPAHIWMDITEHAKLRFPTGAKARDYNILQKISYLAVIFLLLPLMVLTGLSMSPAMNAAWPWLLDLFGGRQSARSIHFIVMVALLGFILVHLAMVLLAGPYNEVRSMITGRYRLPDERK